MKIIIVAFGILLFAYLGYVVGLIAYCDEVPLLRQAKRIVWAIPFYLAIYPLFLLFADEIDNRMETMITFLRLPEKGVFFITVLSKRTQETGKQQQRHSAYHTKPKECSLGWTRIKDLFYASSVAIN